MTRPELLSTRCPTCMSVISPAMTPACISIAAGGVGLLPASATVATDPGRERIPLLPQAPRPVLAGCRVTHVDLPAQMLILSVWLSPVCRSAPAGFQTADIFLHLRAAPRSASGERPWPGSRCWRKALGDFLASAPPRSAPGGRSGGSPAA